VLWSVTPTASKAGQHRAGLADQVTPSRDRASGGVVTNLGELPLEPSPISGSPIDFPPATGRTPRLTDHREFMLRRLNSSCVTSGAALSSSHLHTTVRNCAPTVAMASNGRLFVITGTGERNDPGT